jgi:hypothetical protein
MTSLTGQPTGASRHFLIGGDLPIVRLGHGATRYPVLACGVSHATTTR